MNTHKQKCQALSDQLDVKFLDLEELFHKTYAVRCSVELSEHKKQKLAYFPEEDPSTQSEKILTGFYIKTDVYTHVTKVSVRYKIHATITLINLIKKLNFEQESLESNLVDALEILTQLLEQKE